MSVQKIPHGVMTRQIGGITAGPSMRKINFLRDAVPFLRGLVADLGAASAEDSYLVTEMSSKESGKASFTNSKLKLEVYEDPNTREGVTLSYKVLKADGSLQSSSTRLVSHLIKSDNYGHFVYELSQMLNTMKDHFH